jgi:hypothetical protein
MISAEALAFLRGPHPKPPAKTDAQVVADFSAAVDRICAAMEMSAVLDERGLSMPTAASAMSGKTWLERPPIAQVRLGDMTGDPAHDLGVFERAAEASRGVYIEPGSAADLRMRSGFTAREQELLFGSSITIVEGPPDAQT